ncbi:MAG TPA: GNAT family N-acetyltransferase [Thermoanaerobaculia bacterium]|jgi:CelD/BcsL family acetyltransferase involved in cellulose biosynthesis|nr:GNAT family N-acetyltransferase [Thermoanaerobaculia bacterium]
MNVIAAPPIRCSAITSREAIASLDPEWSALLETTRCHRTFSSHAWYVGSCMRAGSPLLVTLHVDGVLAGLLPLFVPDGEEEAHFPTRMSDYNDAIVERHRRDYAAALIDTVLDFIPAVTLMQLRDDSALMPAVRERAALHSIAGVGTFERLNGYDSWLAARSRAFRKSLFRAQRGAAAAGLTIREITDATVDTFLGLHARRQEKSCFVIPENRALIDFAYSRLVADRRIRLFGLFDSGKLVALDVAMQGYEALCTWNGGFLPEYARFSPGNLLLAHEIRVASAEGIGEFDLMRGGQSYKGSWASGCRDLFTVRLQRG